MEGSYHIQFRYADETSAFSEDVETIRSMAGDDLIYSFVLERDKDGYHGKPCYVGDIISQEDYLDKYIKIFDKLGADYRVERRKEHVDEAQEILSYVLSTQDLVDWDSVEDYTFEDYMRAAPERFRKLLKRYDLKVDGSLLDVASGPASLGTILENVTAYDINPAYIKKLRENGIPAILGYMEDMPFLKSTFDYVFTAYPGISTFDDINDATREFMHRAMEIARKKAVIISPPMMRHFPEELNPYVIFRDNQLYNTYPNNYIIVYPLFHFTLTKLPKI